MSEWKDDDEVTTTYGSIQLSLHQAHAAGQKTERDRIIKLLEKTSFIWMGNVQLMNISKDELMKQIDGDTND